MSFSSLPIVDLKSEADKIHQTLLRACSTTGFFYVKNHHLNSLQDRMFDLSKHFFQLPLEKKLPYSLNTVSYQGYLRIGQENLDSTNSKLIDEKEAFKIRQSDLQDQKQLPDLFSQAENFQSIQIFFQACYDLCMNLFEHLADTFDIDHDYFTSRHRWDGAPGATLKLLHYPPRVKTKFDEASIRAGAHSDYGSLTLLFQQEKQSGLEVYDRSTDTWYPVEARDDMIVVNFGDVFEYWSKGMIKSTIHRVILPIDDRQSRSRFSIAFFCDPNEETVLTPIPSKRIENRIYVKDEHAAHVFIENSEQPLTAGQHLKTRLSRTHKC